jgi:hypothetical protein
MTFSSALLMTKSECVNVIQRIFFNNSCPSIAVVNKRKIVDKNLTFQNRWTEKYFLCALLKELLFGSFVIELKVSREYNVQVTIRNKACIKVEWRIGPVKNGQNNSGSKPSCSTVKFIQKFDQ